MPGFDPVKHAPSNSVYKVVIVTCIRACTSTYIAHIYMYIYVIYEDFSLYLASHSL